jgi:hypothetical protein
VSQEKTTDDGSTGVNTVRRYINCPGTQFSFRSQCDPSTPSIFQEKISDDSGIDVNALLEDTPEAINERRGKESCTGLQAKQLLNALQKVGIVDWLLRKILNINPPR